jgi:hypothetical protein
MGMALYDPKMLMTIKTDSARIQRGRFEKKKHRGFAIDN